MVYGNHLLKTEKNLPLMSLSVACALQPAIEVKLNKMRWEGMLEPFKRS